jgi:hypothetical protein
MSDGTKELIARVLDGDTVKTEDGTSHRLQYIDTPEKNQVGGAEATDLLRRFSQEGTVTPSGEQGKYGRELSTVQDGEGRDYSFEALREGRALPFGNSDTADAAQFLGGTDVADGIAESDPDLANQFDQAVYNEQFQGPNIRPIGGTFKQSMARGGNNLEASLHGFAKTIGDVTGIDAITQYGIEGIERNLKEALTTPAKITKIDDVDSLDDAWTFVVEAIGEQIPQLAGDAAAALLGGGVGGVVARRGAMKALTRSFGPRFTAKLNQARKGDMLPDYQTYAANKLNEAGTTGLKTGARTGAGSAIYAQTAGETAVGFHEEGIDAPGTVLGVGAVKAALEYAPYELLIGNLAKIVGASPRALGQVAGRILTQTGAEGSTEGAQTVLDFMARNHHQGKDIFNMSPEDIDELKIAMAKGAVLGGGLTLPGAIPPAYRAARAKLQRQQPASEPGQDYKDFEEGFVGPTQPASETISDTVTSSEGPEQIAAQIEAFTAGQKRGVFASIEDSDSYEALEAAAEATGGQTISYSTGMLLVGADFDQQAYAEGDNETRNRMRAEVLGYTQAKEDIESPDTAKVVQTQNADGHVIQEEVVDEARVDEVVAAHATQFEGTDINTVVTDPESVQQTRSENTAETVPLTEIYDDNWGVQQVPGPDGEQIVVPVNAQTKIKQVDQQLDLAEKLAVCIRAA